MLTIIAAIADNGAIGRDNRLIYWLPNDLRRFRLLTTDNTIIMGRKTFESLPKGALPRRRNVVLSRSGRAEDFPRCELFRSLSDALHSCEPAENVFVIGGSTVYREALPLADRLCLTLVHDTPADADAFFPEIGPCWQEVQREDHDADERHSHSYSFVDYERRG